MAEVKKIATRESYGNALAKLGKKYSNLVVLDADLAGATKTSVFRKAFPERHIDCGIAESNMMGIAAGLSTTGKVPFASTFAMFAAGRAFEQVRNSIGYPHLNVKIGATHAGISVGEDGATHQCNEDIALMRTIPGMVVINPSAQPAAESARPYSEKQGAARSAFPGLSANTAEKRRSDAPFPNRKHSSESSAPEERSTSAIFFLRVLYRQSGYLSHIFRDACTHALTSSGIPSGFVFTEKSSPIPSYPKMSPPCCTVKTSPPCQYIF